jgi:hypothetical protein
MNKIFDIIKHYNKSATDSSITLYSRNVILTAKALGFKPEEIKPEIFKDIKKVMKVLEEHSIYTQANKITAIYMYLMAMGYNKDVIQDYNDKMYLLSGKSKAKSGTMQWTDKEKDNKVVSVDELMLMLDRMRKELPSDLNTFRSIDKYMKYLLCKIYINYPMRNDISDMKIYTDSEFKNITEDKDINYMVVNPKSMDCYIKLNNFKTKKEGNIKFDIDDKDLVEMIYKYYIACKKFFESNDRDYEHWFIFKNKDYSQMSRNLLTKYMTSIFENEINKKISTTTLRKIITSSLVSPKFQAMAKLQGHSIGTAINNYTKF